MLHNKLGISRTLPLLDDGNKIALAIEGGGIDAWLCNGGETAVSSSGSFRHLLCMGLVLVPSSLGHISLYTTITMVRTRGILRCVNNGGRSIH